MRSFLIVPATVVLALLGGCASLPPADVSSDDLQAMSCDELSVRDAELADAIFRLKSDGGWLALIGDYERQRKVITKAERAKSC